MHAARFATQRTDKQLGSLLEALRSAPKGELDSVQAAVVRDSYKAYVRETAIPKALAQRIAKLESEAYMASGMLCMLVSGCGDDG